MQVARDEEAQVKRKGRSAAVVVDDDEDEQQSAEPVYTPANLRPGCLLLPEFSRPGGISFEKGPGDVKPKRVIKDSPKLEKMSSKVVNRAYAKFVEQFAQLHIGFFCEEGDVEKIPELLREIQKGARYTNEYAKEHGSDRRVRIDAFTIPWDHTSPKWRARLGELTAKKLMSLRKVYTTRNMGDFRVQIDKVRHMEKPLLGEQSRVVLEALNATVQQRKIMIALFGEKQPRDWIDPATGNLRANIRLDFGPIDKAIKMFCPSWKPPADDDEE